MDIAIAGGGAAGMMAALAAAEAGANVTIYEKNARLGKKLLATGNGKCNITNTDCGADNFHGDNPSFARAALERFPPEAVMEFFAGIGLVCEVTRGGRVFPYCGQASAVLDVLRHALTHAGADVRCGCEVAAAERAAGRGFLLRLRGPSGGQTAACDRLLISTGGKSAPSTGSDGWGFSLLSSLGHRIIEPYPALTQLKTDAAAAPLQGVRAHARVSVTRGGGVAAEAEGEIQFTPYGLSGPAAMDISAEALRGGGASLAVDFMPHMGEGALLDELRLRKERLSHLPLEDFLVGMLNKKIGHAVLKRGGEEKLSSLAATLTDGRLSRLAGAIKRFGFDVKGHTGWEHAQTTGGGADTSQFSPETMQSLSVNGLFAAGEAMDIYGGCGGYNLQWAWSSGRAAGLAMGRRGL